MLARVRAQVEEPKKIKDLASFGARSFVFSDVRVATV